ncbi:ferritin-like domain-containing protein [Sphingomicrobium astaxanthinifaciens]|uniref:YciE/YciF ferroxidase family protein n=1 Tax=Sphingomicrobium astaxanthinifaciens TaxID=1227949 RepID=UPI001FCAE631|nr:DUF892 family protein [Sphingomicrobium astaxanthinifaciens]MCJ7420486.1 DUF892 family protein [Sphingomicrobium astaxanthinifaciens]
MSAPKNLEDCYTHELKDLISANDQMKKVVKDLHDAAENDDLKSMLKKTIDGIEKHTQTTEQLLADCGESGKEHCKGMEGLVKEARKHALEEAPHLNAVQDVVILTQYQRMCHYGICGFGSAAAFAEGLCKSDHADKLDQITADIYGSDEEMTKVAESCVNLAAKA